MSVYMHVAGMRTRARSMPGGRSSALGTASRPSMASPLGLTGNTSPGKPGASRFWTSRCPSFAGLREAPSTATPRGAKSGVRSTVTGTTAAPLSGAITARAHRGRHKNRSGGQGLSIKPVRSTPAAPGEPRELADVLDLVDATERVTEARGFARADPRLGEGPELLAQLPGKPLGVAAEPQVAHLLPHGTFPEPHDGPGARFVELSPGKEADAAGQLAGGGIPDRLGGEMVFPDVAAEQRARGAVGHAELPPEPRIGLSLVRHQ